jgi:predicted patatin/cPLA2 family phospholipase
MRSKLLWIFLLFISVVFLLNGCGTVPIRTPLPAELSEDAQIPGIPRAKFWGDEVPPFFETVVKQSPDALTKEFPAIYGQEHNYLALSGGGANGAFGAGLLVGWSEAGTRPTFTMVTGISTGALIAPFAFLGSAYDAKLKEMYSRYSTKDLIDEHSLLETITGSSAAGTEPLKKMLAKYFDREFLEAVAAEHRKGRRLFIGTTNLDARRPVIWNIGLIAESGRPEALDLIQKVLLASASIPGAFPPVIFEVDSDGKRYDELHVDGGAAAQVFLYPADLQWQFVLRNFKVKGTPRAYVIRNSFLKPEYKAIEAKIFPIANMTIESLIRTQGIGDMYRIYLDCQRDGIEYNLAYIPDTFDVNPDELFDPVYMRQLFDLGYRMAQAGYPWDKAPPGFE